MSGVPTNKVWIFCWNILSKLAPNCSVRIGSDNCSKDSLVPVESSGNSSKVCLCSVFSLQKNRRQRSRAWCRGPAPPSLGSLASVTIWRSWLSHCGHRGCWGLLGHLLVPAWLSRPRPLARPRSLPWAGVPATHRSNNIYNIIYNVISYEENSYIYNAHTYYIAHPTCRSVTWASVQPPSYWVTKSVTWNNFLKYMQQLSQIHVKTFTNTCNNVYKYMQQLLQIHATCSTNTCNNFFSNTCNNFCKCSLYLNIQIFYLKTALIYLLDQSDGNPVKKYNII